MRPDVLRKVNQYIKKNRPYLNPLYPCQVFKETNLLEIGFLSKRCKYDAMGTCIMCDYGCAKGSYSHEEYLNEMDRILAEHCEGITILLLCSNGSILNSNQISDELFRKILLRAARTGIPQIEIECHYKDVTEDKLKMIKETIPHKQVTIEMGLETVNPVYQKLFFGKEIDLSTYENVLECIHSYGFQADLNIILGLPFLTSSEQLKDTLQTLNWVFDHHCSPVIFPVNIKPFTLLMHMYQSGYYKPISHWLMILLLNLIEEDKLDQVVIAWYGNREEIYKDTDSRAIFPTACHNCAEAITDFYHKFISCKHSRMRKKYLRDMMDLSVCSCLEKLKFSEEISNDFEKQYESYTDLLLNEFSFLFQEENK